MKLFVLIALLTTTLCVALCTGCGGNGGAANALLGATSADNTTGGTPHHDYGQVIAGFANVPAPDDVDHALWKELTAALADALEKRQAADAPLIDAARVNDLSFELTADPQTKFAWNYLNPGDYDLNGEANISDLAKVAEYFTLNAESPDWANAQVADGDGNGEVNLADVTLIAQNYMAVVSGYVLQASDAETDAPWSDVGQMNYADVVVPQGGGIPRFNLSVAAPEYGKYYRVVPFEKTGSGEIVHTSTGAAGVPVLYTPDARGDWHTLGANSQHTSLSTHAGPTTNHVYWKHEIGGDGKSSPVYNVAGTIYVGGGDGLYIINPDHTSVSVYPTPDVIETTPAISKDGTVYFGCNDGVFRAISPGGGLKWSFTAGDAIRSSPTVAEDGTVYFGSDDGNLYALAPDGELKWLHGFGEPIFHAPTLRSDGRISVVVDYHELFSSFDMGDHAQFNETGMDVYGRPLYAFLEFKPEEWLYQVELPEEPIETLIVPAMGYVLGYPNYPEPINFAYPHRIEWKLPNEWGGTFTTPAMSPDGNIYFIGVDYELSKFNPAGTPIWEAPYFRASFYGQTPSVDSFGRVYMGAMSSNLQAINSDNSELWNFTIFSSFVSQIAIADSIIYAVNEDGWIYAIGGPLSGTLPDVPIHFSARPDASFDYIELNWIAPNGAAGYEVFRDSESNLIATLGNETTYRDTGLESGIQHEYWVRAVNNAGSGELTSGVYGNTRLAVPQNITASNGLYPDKIALTWDAVPNATSYGIYREVWYSNYEPDVIVEGQTFFYDTEITDWDIHEYFVTAMTSFTESRHDPPTEGYLSRGVGDSGAGSWNQYRANPSHTNQGSVSGPTSGNLAWVHQPAQRFSIGITAAPIFGSEGAVYIADNSTLLCLNQDGTLRWSTDSRSLFPVIASDGAIVTWRSVPSLDYPLPRELVVLNSDGTDRLVSDNIEPEGMAIIDDDTIFTISGSSIVSFNLDASINWTYAHETPINGSMPTVSPDGSVIFISQSWQSAPTQGGPGPPPDPDAKYPFDITALNPDGTLKWVRHYPDRISNPIAGIDGSVYFQEYDGRDLVALNPDGSDAWVKDYSGSLFFVADSNGIVYAAQSDGTMQAYHADGTLAWSQDYSAYSPLGVASTPILDSNGNIFMIFHGPGAANTIVVCNSLGDEIWSYQVNPGNFNSFSLDDFGRLFFQGPEEIDERYTYNTYCIGPPM